MKRKILLFFCLVCSIGAFSQTRTKSSPIVLSNQSNVVIKDLIISDVEGNGIELKNCSNITIENCEIRNTSLYGVTGTGSANITIRNCIFENNMTAIWFYTTTALVAENNSCKNVQGPFPRGQFLQMDHCDGPGHRISCNYIVNELGKSYPEDVINLYMTSGTSSSPVIIENNYINGGGPSTSGGGILAGDKTGGNVIVRNNVLVNPGQYGIGFSAAGSNVQILDNKLYARQQSFTNVAITVWNAYDGTCSNVEVTRNYVYWVCGRSICGPGAQNPLYVASGSGACSNVNTSGNFFNSNQVSESMAAPACAGPQNGAATVNQAPSANAGADQAIQLPTNKATLSGTGTDKDGSISSYAWSQVSGPSKATIGSPSSATSTKSDLIQGTYVFRLTVTDNQGATGTDDVQVSVAAAPQPNKAPIANAGSDKTITLPTNQTSLSGSGTDGDGTVSSYAWTQVSGPNTAGISSPSSASTNVTGMLQGNYVFRLTVTDNEGAKGTDDVQVTVNAAPPPNQAPTANAGSNKSIQLPTNSVSIAGTGTDTDGTISAYSWSQVSGPNTAGISARTSATTNMTGLVQGTYVFRLTVTDNDGATDNDDVQVTVAAAAPPPNQAPVANAGSNKSIQLPTNSVSIAGTGTDSDGTISAYSWSQVSGPNTAGMSARTSATTNLTGLVQGTYVFRLTVTDNDGATDNDDVQVTVAAAAPPPNQAPVANAGSNKSIQLPTNSVSIAGTGTDSDGTISSYAWSQVSGPNTAGISASTSATTNMTGLVQGTYVFRLTVTDNDGATDNDDVQVTVSAAAVSPNQAPTANAGSNKNIQLPTNSVSLVGTGTDNDGTISSYGWSQVSGPNTAGMSARTSATTNMTGLVQGTYVFRLTVTDNDGATDNDDVQVTVAAAAVAPNQAPTANAGSNKTIQLPTNSVSLAGTGADSDGSISSYGWNQVSGPNTAGISANTSATTNVTGLVQGTYVFRLTVTDNDGATDNDDVQVTVTAAAPPPNQAPVANAGSNKTIQLPTNSVSLAGTGTDSDGTISSYGWSQVSGPNTAGISASTSANTNMTGLEEGTYVFRLTVTDNDGATDNDDVQVTVTAAAVVANAAPIANAGGDKSVQLPTNNVMLAGSGSDSDGTIAGYAWTQVSGPNSAAIGSPRTSQCQMSGLVKGNYIFRLTVTDNDGAKNSDDVSVAVKDAAPPPNQDPTANAGADISTQLPDDKVTVKGSGTDSDGSIATYSWRLVSGPNSPSIADPNSASTTISGLVEGTYVFRLTVTDDKGANATDDVKVIVAAAPTPAPPPAPAPNKAPVAAAGKDVSITLPTNTVNLDGSKSSDPDGQIVTWKWARVKGPKVLKINNDNTAKPQITGLDVKGSYEIELTVTDDKGAVSKDIVVITVIKINKKPVAMVASDTLSIALPSQSVELDGSSSYDPDGNISQYLWTYDSGPDTPRILSENSAKSVATDLVSGTYRFTLDVVDNDGGLAHKTVIVIVKNNVDLRLVPIVNEYPNPVTSQATFTIETPANGKTTITLFNINGVAVKNFEFNKNSTLVKKTINIADLQRGTYMAVVQVDGQERAVKKIIKL